MLNPTSPFKNICGVAKGATLLNHLQFSGAAAADDVTFNRGSLVSLDAQGKIKLGCGDCEMPMWALQASDDYSVAHDSHNIAGPGPGLIVGTGGFEVFTSEYAVGTYAPNQPLTAGAGDDAGKVAESGALYNDAVVVGLVSRGVKQDYNEQTNVLYFWPVFIPKHSATAPATTTTTTTTTAAG